MEKSFKREVIKLLSVLSPVLATRLLYRRSFHKKLDLKNPKTFNEKIQYLKLFDYYDNALVSQCADKYKVREYLQSVGCSEILNELILSCDKVDEIPWGELPDKFVIKCNHGCGYNLICQDKNKLNIDSAKLTINTWMAEDFWKNFAETNYKNIPKKITIEKFIDSGSELSLDDYKVHCFNGVPEFVMLCIGRDKGKPKYHYFDREFKLLSYSKDSVDFSEDEISKFAKPVGYEKLFEYAAILAKPFPFVRADFYLNGGVIIFGELTFTPAAGLDVDLPPSTDLILGDLLKLNNFS